MMQRGITQDPGADQSVGQGPAGNSFARMRDNSPHSRDEHIAYTHQREDSFESHQSAGNLVYMPVPIVPNRSRQISDES